MKQLLPPAGNLQPEVGQCVAGEEVGGDDRSLNRVQCGFLDPQDEETLLENYYFFKKEQRVYK